MDKLSKKAFTLIELLVVISIIGIISGFVVVQLSGATEAGRDARRKADIDVLRKALVYRSVDTGGLYPVQATACTIGDLSGANKCPTSFGTDLLTYIKRLPVDPVSGYYTYQSTNGTDCTVIAILSNGGTYQYSCANKTFSTIAPVSGSCGTRANTTSSPYAQAATDWPTSTTYCSEGTASASPSFPSAGNSVSWNCTGPGGSSSCNAYHALNGSCGTANKSYNSPASSYGTDTFCASGTLSGTPAFPITSAQNWTCSGSNGGTNASCSSHYCTEDSTKRSEYISECSAAGGSFKTVSGDYTYWYCTGVLATRLNNDGTATTAHTCAYEYWDAQNPGTGKTAYLFYGTTTYYYTHAQCAFIAKGGACPAVSPDTTCVNCYWYNRDPFTGVVTTNTQTTNLTTMCRYMTLSCN